MNSLYATTAVIEVGAGLALLCAPSAAAALLLGRPLEAPAALTVALILGAAGIQSQPVGIVLWPAVVLHAAMTISCITNLLEWGSKEIKGSH